MQTSELSTLNYPSYLGKPSSKSRQMRTSISEEKSFIITYR
jgi:hypothetical protein